MTSDRELLEAAARAAGMRVLPQPWPNEEGWFFCVQHESPGMHFRDLGSRRVAVAPWRPLTDDGDALRLAVKLRLVVDMSTGDDIHVQYPIDTAYRPLIEEDEPDPYAATRRAIVRAAAAIAGKEKTT